jgi:hypothetical protein
MSFGSMHTFIPVGATSRFNSNTTASNGVQLAGDDKQVAGVHRQYRIIQHGNDTVWVSFASTNTGAANNAVIPTNATVGGNAYSVPPNTPVFITAPMGQFWTGIVATTNTATFITPGKGR